MTDATNARGWSLVVCCHDSAEVIEPTIAALAALDAPDEPVELVLIDNRCGDDTVERARRAWPPRAGALRILREPSPGLIHARHTAVGAASYDKILFIDDDNLLAPDWLTRAGDILEKHAEVGALGGHNEPMPQFRKPEWLDRYLGVYACGGQGTAGCVGRTRKLLFGAGLAARTALLRQVFSGDPPLYLVGRTGGRLLRGDDAEICHRIVLLGAELLYEPALRLRHYLLDRRLRWSYVLEARAGGGLAAPILRMYTRMIDGKEPLSYGQALRALWRERRRLLLCGGAVGPGSEREFEAAFLRGQVRGLWSLLGRYGKIRRRLWRAFGRVPRR